MSHLEVCAGADRNGGRALEADADFEHRDIVGRTHADQRGLVIAAVGQLDRGIRRPLDHMKVGNDMTGVIPDETRTRPARHGKDVARPGIAHQLGRRDVDHRCSGLLEQFDGGLFISGQIATRRDGALSGLARTEPGLDGGQELPEQHECGNARSDEEPPPDEMIRSWALWVRIVVSYGGGSFRVI